MGELIGLPWWAWRDGAECRRNTRSMPKTKCLTKGEEQTPTLRTGELNLHQKIHQGMQIAEARQGLMPRPTKRPPPVKLPWSNSRERRHQKKCWNDVETMFNEVLKLCWNEVCWIEVCTRKTSCQHHFTIMAILPRFSPFFDTVDPARKSQLLNPAPNPPESQPTPPHTAPLNPGPNPEPQKTSKTSPAQGPLPKQLQNNPKTPAPPRPPQSPPPQKKKGVAFLLPVGDFWLTVELLCLQSIQVLIIRGIFHYVQSSNCKQRSSNCKQKTPKYIVVSKMLYCKQEASNCKQKIASQNKQTENPPHLCELISSIWHHHQITLSKESGHAKHGRLHTLISLPENPGFPGHPVECSPNFFRANLCMEDLSGRCLMLKRISPTWLSREKFNTSERAQPSGKECLRVKLANRQVWSNQVWECPPSKK